MAMNGDQLGIAIADALSVSDSEAIEKWKNIGNMIVSHITDNITINFNPVFTLGVPVPMDGGAVLQTTWKALPPQGGLVE